MEIEVKHSDFYVEALVLNISDTKFEVNYDGMSESSGWVDFEYCRARIDPSEDKAKILKVKVGDVVDAYVSYQDDRKAWRKMKIQSIKDRRAVVHRVDDTKMTETIPIQHCRHPKLSMQITPSSIQTRKFALDDLFEFFKQNEQHYKVLHDSVPGLLIKLEDEGKQLVIKALTQSIISKVDMLMAFFFDNSRQKLGLIKKQKWLKEFVREPIIDAPCIIEFEFDVLLGRQIDSNGGNLKDALAAIKVLGNIFADTMDAAGSARNMLEIFHRVEFASKEIVEYIIGEGGHNIQKIVHESDVLRVVIGDEGLDGFIPFTFIGTREALNLAAFLFSFNVKQFSMLEDYEQYDPIKLLEKAEYYYDLKPADLVQCSHKLWLSCVFSVKRLFLIYGICIKSHKTLTTFCNYAIVCSPFDPATKGRLFDGWRAGGFLHSFTYATGLRKSTFDYYMEMVKFFVINFGKITTNHILPDLSEFLKQHNGFNLKLEEGNCLIGGRLYDYDTAAYTN